MTAAVAAAADCCGGGGNDGWSCVLWQWADLNGFWPGIKQKEKVHI